MKTKNSIKSLLMIVVCLVFTVTHSGNINTAEAAKKKQKYLHFATAPFTLNTENTIRVLLHNPFPETTLQIKVSIFDFITGDEIATKIFDTRPGHGISRTVEIPNFLDSRSIFMRLSVTSDLEIWEIKKNPIKQNRVLNTLIGIERLNDSQGTIRV